VMRRWMSVVLAGLIPAVYAAAFLTMSWIRSQQGHGGHVYRSEIESLAIHSGPVDPLADARDRGALVYQHYCQLCHGKKGNGKGPKASNLERPPRNLTDETFWQETSEERVHDAIAHGGSYVGKSVLMPAWGNTLTEQEISDVVAFIHAFAGATETE